MNSTADPPGEGALFDPQRVKEDLSACLDALEAVLRRYVSFTTPEQATVLALFVVHTWFFEDDRVETTPYIAVRSVEPESGKSRLLEVLDLLVRRPWLAINPSESVMFRNIEENHPTLLLDETDTIFGPTAGPYEALRSILNAGFRKGVRVPRSVASGRSFKVEHFEVFCPKVLAGLGKLPDTIRSRSIIIELRRKKADEPISRFRRRRVELETRPLREALAQFAESESLGYGEYFTDGVLSDRMADACEPLMLVAELAGRTWKARAQAAIEALCGPSGQLNRESEGVALLSNIRSILEVAGNPPNITTRDLLKGLNDEESWPWRLTGSSGLTPYTLAARLRPYVIKPGTIRQGDETAKGYTFEGFTDTFDRYLPRSDDDEEEEPCDDVTDLGPPPEEEKHALRLVLTGFPGSRVVSSPHAAFLLPRPI